MPDVPQKAAEILIGKYDAWLQHKGTPEFFEKRKELDEAFLRALSSIQIEAMNFIILRFNEERVYRANNSL
jgi:hypothetical protein